MFSFKKHSDEICVPKGRPLGQLLLDGELIVSHDLSFALEHQQHSRELLGQILVRMGALSKQELEKMLKEQARESAC